MTLQNIVPVIGLNEVSGGGLLIGWLPFYYGAACTNQGCRNILTWGKIGSQFAYPYREEREDIPRQCLTLSTPSSRQTPLLTQILDRSPDANISADSVWTSFLPFATTRPDTAARALSKP